MANIRPKYGQNMAKIMPRFGQDMTNIYGQVTLKIWPRCGQYMAKIWPRYAQDMAKIQSRYSQEAMVKKWTRLCIVRYGIFVCNKTEIQKSATVKWISLFVTIIDIK